MVEFLIGVLLAAAAVFWVLRPVFQGVLTFTDAERALDLAEDDDPDDDLSSQAVALRALREIEFDRATGKLSDADYDSLHRKYTAEALAAMRAQEAGEQRKAKITKPGGAAAAARAAVPTCPTHGRRPEPDAAFCSECGRRLGAAVTFCARCGTGLESDARFCHACGSRIAA